VTVIYHTDNQKTRREKRMAHKLKYCRHYDPDGAFARFLKEPSGLCKAGCKYADIGENFKERPCIDGLKNPELQSRCAQFSPYTMEEATTYAGEMEAWERRMEKVGKVVSEWRKKPPIGKQEVIECPERKGRLHLSQAASNGQVYGRCETADCVSFME
jgi:hypothetical protein